MTVLDSLNKTEEWANIAKEKYCGIYAGYTDIEEEMLKMERNVKAQQGMKQSRRGR